MKQVRSKTVKSAGNTMRIIDKTFQGGADLKPTAGFSRFLEFGTCTGIPLFAPFFSNLNDDGLCPRQPYRLVTLARA